MVWLRFKNLRFKNLKFMVILKILVKSRFRQDEWYGEDLKI